MEYGVGVRRRRRRRGELMAKKATLSGYTLTANSPEGTVVGNVTNKIADSTISLIDDAGGRLKLVGSTIQAGSVTATGGEYLATLKEQNSMATQLTQLNISVLAAKGSLLLDTTKYLSIPNNVAFSQDTAFTYEGWFYPTSLDDSYLFIMLQHNWIGVAYKNGGKFTLDKSYVGNPNNYNPQNRTYPINNWYHVALSFDGTNGYLFINGVVEATFTGAGATVEDGNPLLIGKYQDQSFGTFQGNVSNFRAVKGSAVYTAPFTPPTAQLTAVTGTQLLLNTTNDADFLKDSSTNNFTVTNVGGVTSSALNPF